MDRRRDSSRRAWAVKRHLAIAAVAFALVAAPAQAGELGRDVAAARQHWGTVPACLTITWGGVPGGGAGFAEMPGCHVWLDLDIWRGTGRYERCVMVVHEIGHTLGHTHAEGGVMSANAQETYAFNSAPTCRRLVARMDRDGHARQRRRHRRRRHKARRAVSARTARSGHRAPRYR